MRAAADQAWPAFVLVCGLLLCARAASEDGVLRAGAALLERTPGSPRALLGAGMLLVFVVTAVLNLDTAATFLTEVLILAARRRGADERPFLYATILMVNASSLALPGANLTNLIALAGDPISGTRYLARYGPMAAGVAAVTALGVLLIYRRRLAAPARRPPEPDSVRPGALGLLTTAAAAVAVVALPRPALPVLGVGLVAVAVLIARRRLGARDLLRTVDLRVIGALFVVAVAAGALGRAVGDPAHLRHAGAPRTAITAALASVVINNLPAASLLASGPVAHPGALLLGLGVGPNLLVTGSLSALLWWRAARAAGAQPSARELTRAGVLVVPPALAVGLLLL